MNFLGKWSFAQGGKFITLDPQTGQLNVSGPSDGDNQKLNAYGTGAQFMLQAANGKYIASNGNGYEAKLARDGDVSYFSLLASGNSFAVVDLGIKGTGSPQYFWVDQGDALQRVEKTGTPPANALFVQNIVTIGLDDMLASGFTVPFPDLRWVYLAGADLSSMMDFNNVNASNADFSNVNLSGVPMNSCNFSNATAINFKATGLAADLSSSVLALANFTGANFQGATLIKVDFTGAIMVNADFTNCTLIEPGFIDTNLTGVKMSNPAQGQGLPGISLEKMKFSKKTNFTACKMRYNDLRGRDFSNVVFTHADLTGCKMDNTVLNNTEMSYANLTSTTLTGNVSMTGTNFSNATLTNANMTGAQMGSIGLRFSVTSPAEVSRFQTALEAGDVATVKDIFNTNGYPLTGAVIITPSAYAPGRVWQVQSTDQAYSVFLQNNGTVLSVYQAVVAAILVNAFMMGTILTSANLYNVRAAGVQLYGGAKLDGNAILEGAQFDNANLGNINLKQAQLYGVNFDYTVLTGAQLQGAKMTVSSSGGAVTLLRANLQGADFSDTALDDAIFTDAAVAVPVAANNVSGVWLFGTNATPFLSAELNSAANGFTLPLQLLPYLHQGIVTPQICAGFAANGITISPSAIVSVQQYGPYWTMTSGSKVYVIFESIDTVNYVPALGVASGTDDTQTPEFFIPLYLSPQLQTGPATPDVIAAFKTNGGITLASSATVGVMQEQTDWLLTDTSASYNLWRGLSMMGELSLNARSAIPSLLSLFSMHSTPLSSRANVSILSTGTWLVDNDANNPFNPVTNYIKFVLSTSSSGSAINTYGQMLRVVRLSAAGQTEFENFVCETTNLPVAVLKPSTVCPNSARTDVNTTQGLSFNQWMQANYLPQAPFCVPSADGTYYCPQSPPSSP